MRWVGVSLCLTCLFLGGCSGLSVDTYAGNTPVFEPRTFFDGPLVAHGVVKNRSGEVIRRFTADIQASWQVDVGTLEEDFVFTDGETDRRVWTLKPHPDGGYVGTAGDVVGEGRIRLAGNAMFLNYVLQVPWGDGSVDVRVDDRMYLVTPDVLINESVMTKFGLRVGEIVLTIRRLASG